MNPYLVSILIAVLFLVIGLVIGQIISKLKASNTTTALNAKLEHSNDLLGDKDKILERLNEDVELIRKEKEHAIQDVTRKTSEIEYLQEKLNEQKKEVEDLQVKFTKEFKLLANEILESNSSKITKQNKENLESILNPLREKIKTFEEKVEKTSKESIGMHSALKQQLEGLKDLNQQMSKEAINLANALKGDSKAQGDWGEVQLEIILEKVGLKNGVHYSTQGGYRDEEDNLKKPDVIINLPDHKHLIVDSKVSLTAYEGYYSAENETEKAENLKKHILSIRKHIKELGDKRYQDLYDIRTPDYVLMFVPIEAALLIALNENDKLYLEAFDKNVVLVTTSTLLATLSTVSSIWKQEDQKKNVMEIARQAGALYDKFAGFLDDLKGVGKKLDDAKKDYSSAMNKLVDGRGNLITSVEKIKKLGVKTKKSLPEAFLSRASEDEE